MTCYQQHPDKFPHLFINGEDIGPADDMLFAAGAWVPMVRNGSETADKAIERLLSEPDRKYQIRWLPESRKEKIMSSQISPEEKVRAVEELIRQHEESVKTEISALQIAKESDKDMLSHLRLEGQFFSKMASLNSDLILEIRRIIVPNFEVAAKATA